MVRLSKLLFGSLILGVTSFALGSNLSASEADQPDRVFSAEVGVLVNNTGQSIEETLQNLDLAIKTYYLSSYERSTIEQMRGGMLYELDRQSEAITAFENAIKAGGLLPSEIKSLDLNIAQLMIASTRYEEGAKRLSNWMDLYGETPKYIEHVMQAWILAGAYDLALPWAEKWFLAASPKQQKHIDLLTYLYDQLGIITLPAATAEELKLAKAELSKHQFDR